MILEKRTGVYLSVEDAVENKRRNMYIPGADGQVYHLHENDLLAICTKADKVPSVPVLQEGIRLKLPRKIEWSLMERFIAIARYYAFQHTVEFHSEIYWNPNLGEYRMVIPNQKVSMSYVEPQSHFVGEDWIKVVEVHSHHYWEATPSSTDNQNERQTILYVIVGKLQEFFPQITVRTFFNDKHYPINPWEVFESPVPEWTDSLPQVEILKGGNEDDSAVEGL
jgi:hypothetical protein